MGSFGVGKNFHYIAAHEIAVRLGTESAKALPAFRAFTGCGTVSFFAGKWKAKAWEVCSLASGPATLHETSLDTFEQFVVLVYNKNQQSDENEWSKAASVLKLLVTGEHSA